MNLPVRRDRDDAQALERWNPFEELDRLTRQLRSLLDALPRFADDLGIGFTPVADVVETPDSYVVEVELPGVDRQDIDIEIAGRRLSVTGERKTKERTGILRRRERIIGRFSYEVTLPGDIDEDAADARLADGVLTVRLPKPESARPRRIEVK
jgi:HSP20 family protein